MPASPAETAPETVEQPVVDQTPVADATSAVATQDGNAANSSVADDKGGKEPQSGLEAVMAAVDKLKAAEGKSPDPENGQEKTADAAEGEGKPEAEEALSEDPSPEELARYSSKTRQRVKKLLDQRDEWKSKATEFETGHNNFQRIVNYATEHGISHEEMGRGFTIMAAMRKAPAQALEMLMPYVEGLRKVLGETIPPELQQQVDQGYITPELARQAARDRAQADLARQEAESERQRRQAEADRATQAKFAQDVGSAVSAYERNWRQSDPDYALKHQRVAEKFDLATSKGWRPQSAEDAVAHVKKWREEVEAEIARFRPKPVAIKPVAAAGASQSTRPAPKSTLEAMEQALAS